MPSKAKGAGLVITVALAAAVVFAAIGVATMDSGTLGLSSTKLALEVDESEDLTTWSLPEGCKYSDITWRSYDEEVATVTAGTVKGVKAGTTTVEASVGGHVVDCLVTVSESVEDALTVYNPYSDDYDYAVLSGEGFLGNSERGGTLALSFNEGGYVMVSLAGYTWDWYSGDTDSLGSHVSDFNKVKMQIQKDGTAVAVSEYGFSSSGGGHVFTTADGVTYNKSSYTTDIYAKGLGTGEYTAVFELYKGSSDASPQATVTGTFVLCHGDGRYDTASEFTRSYAWKAAVDDTAKAQQFSMNVTYSYADYWNGVMKSKTSNIRYSNGLQNHASFSELPGFCTADSSVTSLQEALKARYQEAFPSLSVTGQEYAQFLLTFVQLEMLYEHDYAQNYDCGDPDGATDVWAYPSMTLMSGKGDCEDTSILLSTLYKLAGYGTGLMVFDDHVKAAVELDSCTNYGTDATIDRALYKSRSYYPCETTSTSPTFFVDDKSQMGKNIYTYSASFNNKEKIESYDVHEYRLVGCLLDSDLYLDYTFLEVE